MNTTLKTLNLYGNNQLGDEAEQMVRAAVKGRKGFKLMI